MKENKKLEKAFIHLIQHQSGIIHSLCQSYYGCWQDQQDCRQDIILQLWRSFAGFRGQSKTSTWVYSVALRTILNRRRREKNQIKVNPLERSQRWPIVLPKADDHHQLVRQLLLLLDDRDRALMILYLEGYKYSEIAAMLEISRTHVSTLICRIKQNLRIQVKKSPHAYR